MTAVHYLLNSSKWLTAMRENSPRAIRAHLRAVQSGEGIFALLSSRLVPAIPSLQTATGRPRIAKAPAGSIATATPTVLGNSKRPSTKATGPTRATSTTTGATGAAAGNKAFHATAAVIVPEEKAKTHVKAKTKVEAETQVKPKTPAKARTKATKAMAVVRAAAMTPATVGPATASGMSKETAAFLRERIEAQAGVIIDLLPKHERLQREHLELKAHYEATTAEVAQARNAACVAFVGAFVAARALASEAPSRIKRVGRASQAARRSASAYRVKTVHKVRLAFQRPAVQRYSVYFSGCMRECWRAAKFLAKTFLQGAGVGFALIVLSFLDYYYARQIKERHLQDQALVAAIEMQEEVLRQEEQLRLRKEQQEIDLRDAEAKELASLNAFELAEREYKARAPWGSNPEDTESETPRLV